MNGNQLSTQQLVEIKEIRDGVVYLKNGGLRQILIVGGINFDLKSESEQNLIISTFQNFLNMFDFPVQFFIHSRKVNIENYLQKIAQLKETETNELLKVQLDEYINFIRTFVEQNAIITKKFFVVISYDPTPLKTESSLAAGGLSSLLPFFKKKISAPAPDISFKQALQQLNERVDQVLNGLNQMGLKAAILNDEELIELFYNLYNPQLKETKIPLPEESKQDQENLWQK